MYDLLLKGGRVIDPSQSIDDYQDIAVTGGQIAKIDKDIPVSQSLRTIDVSGKIVTPGLIDLHTHVYWGVSDTAVEADPACLAKGVTTAVDAGTAGAINFPGLKRYVVERSQTRILCFLNIAPTGLPTFYPSDLYGSLQYADVVSPIRLAQENRDVIIGIKVLLSQHYVWNKGLQPLWLARFVADKAQCPLMIHIGNTPTPLTEFLGLMRPGDILTHCFTGLANGILDYAGKVIPAIQEALDRGVILDVGHGSGSFSFNVAKLALAQGLRPTISTDLQSLSIKGPVYDLPTTMSKFIALGLSLPEVVKATTIDAAKAIGWGKELGSLRIGAVGDIAVFDMLEGEFEFRDAHNNSMIGQRRLEPILTVRDGKVFEGNKAI